MNYPMDPQMMRFYQEMGFNQQQIRRAHDYALRTGADVLDTLNNMQQVQAPQPPPPKQQNNYVQKLPNTNIKIPTGYLAPLSKIKVSDYEIIFSRSSKQMHSSSKVQLRQAEYPVGLLNVSNCCYLNSLLQCYFLMNSFKIAILTAQPLPNVQKALENESKTKVKRIKSEYELLAKLKWFFTKMSLTSKKYLDPTTVLQNLVDSVGEKVSYGQQKDLSEINILIIERLSEGLTYSKNHYQIQQQNLISFQIGQKQAKRQVYNSIFNPRQGSIKKLFYGTKAQYYANSASQNQPPIVNDFTGLILNPRAGSLYKALDDQLNFEVQINGGIHKKIAYIRDEPQYLFLYINRAEYDKEEGQTLKNRHKFNFDFTIYMDRYLQKYRESHSVAHQKIRQLLASKQKLITKLNNLNLLWKKLEECHKYAQQLQGWSQKLPTEQQFDDEFANLQQKLQQIQNQLNQIQSRKEQYHLMYIFVHRGDAVSGHYWGYGRNDLSWYKFDINTKKIQQDQIIIDLQKSAATPYALLYVKQQNLPRFDYKVWNQHVLFKQQNFSPTDFRHYLEPKLSFETITENQQLYNQFQLRTNKIIKSRSSSEYIARYNLIKKLGKKYNQQRTKSKYLDHVELVNNFSLFLWSKEQYQLCKFTLFQQALLSASNHKITVQKLMNDSTFLNKIQKKFRGNCKGEYYLKSYALLPKQIDKYVKLAQQYHLSSFETIWSVIVLNQADNFIEQWNQSKLKHKVIPIPIQEHLKQRTIRLLKLIKIRQNLVRSEPYRQALQFLGEPLWISFMNRQITAMILFQIEVSGIKLASIQSYMNLSDTIGTQLALINAGNSVEIDQLSLNSITRETSIDLVNKFNQNQVNKNNQSSNLNSKKNSQKRVSRQQGQGSPSKSNAMVKQTTVKEKKIQQRLTATPKPIFILQNKECWKVQQTEKCQLNYDFNLRLVTFLKKIGILREIYQKVLKGGKTFNMNQLKQLGLLLNQIQKLQPPKDIQQSLI